MQHAIAPYPGLSYPHLFEGSLDNLQWPQLKDESVNGVWIDWQFISSVLKLN